MSTDIDRSETDTSETIVAITDAALEQIIALREAEAIPNLHLGLRIAGVGHNGFVYETAFLRAADVGPDDLVEDHGGLPVAIPQDSVENLRGAVMDMSSDPAAPGLVLRNPNPPTPAGGGLGLPDIELEGTVEERITMLLDQAINPAIAGHGGWTRLLSVDGDTAYLELGGGCQGCGLAAMTLRHGIETAIKEKIPEIADVVDMTDHASGVNPYYA
jgi:Fe/S biogenesis protein NfuA